MDKYRFTVALDEEIHERPYSNEELKFLDGSGVPELIEFRRLLGLRDNFRVSTGMNVTAWTVKNREALLAATVALLRRMETEAELFGLTFKLSCPGSLSRGSSKCWIELTPGKAGHLLARHPGQLYFHWKETPMSEPEIVDLRAQALETGSICGARVYSKPNELRWTQFLRELASFLQNGKSAEVRIRHDFAPKET